MFGISLHRRSRFFMTIAAALLALGAIMVPFTASAHEHRTVGKYEFVVGFVNEPAVQGQMNGIDLTITQNGKAVTGADQTLKAQLVFGSATKDVDLEAVYKQDGKYTAPFIPTQPGDYTFIFTGTLGGQTINEKFTSSPSTFDAVAPASDYEFPPATATSN